MSALAPGAQTTFNRDIAPILYKNCATCHRPGESGPFSLLTYQDAKRHASQIADVTRRRYMPPFLPERGYGDFAEERRLSDGQIATIQEWVKQGAPEGLSSDAPPLPKFASGWQLGTPDLIVQPAKPYQLPADGPEIFWNFVIPVPLTRARWVKAVEIRPGAPKAIHHASIILDRSHSAREKHPEGFSGMDLNIAESSFDPDGTFLAWKPGSVPMVEPDGMAWHATPGMDLILNAHLRPTGKPETVQPSIGLYFTDQPQTKFPLLIELEHDGAIDIPPGAHDYLVSDDFTTPLDIKVLAIYPHAHYLGKLLEGYATLPGGERKWLIRIPEWDLSWQGVFHYKQPVFLPRGTKISMRFHYDNSAENIRNPHHPPVRVRGGSHADDEMGNLWLQVLPAIEADQRPALQEAVMRRLLEKYPSDFSANYILGDLLLSKGDAVNAIRYFEAASTAEPRNAVAAAEWGVALASAKRMAEAKRQFERALALDPKFTDARYDLASAQAAEGDFESAARNLRQAITERPTEPKFGDRLGEVLFAWGDAAADAGQHTEAVEHYREALSYRSEDPELHTNLGVELAKLGQLQPAETELVTALRLKPDLQPARAALEVVRAQVARKLQ